MLKRWRVWGLSVLSFLVLSSSGPCYNDDCSNPGEGWCSGETAKFCAGAGDNAAYSLVTEDCAALELTCVEGLGAGYDGPETQLSWCLDTRTCDADGDFLCETSAADGSPMLMRCVDVSSTEWFTDNEISAFVSHPDLQLIREPVSGGGYGFQSETPLPCIECKSTCGCDVASVCRNGLCVPAEAAGETDENLVCCGKERQTVCLKGEACENLDGSQGVCTSATKCDPCETTDDCETDQLDCVSTGGETPTVCLNPEEVDKATYDCREDLGQAWKQDVCGGWVESAEDVPMAYACREDTDQSWSLNACDQWIAMVEDCGAGYRCENNECILRVPEIEVSPTLLDFGDIVVSEDKTLTLSIGNIGDGALLVQEILLEPASVKSFGLSHSSAEVAANEIVSIDITFAPSETGNVQAKLLIHSNDEDEPEVVVLMNGNGVASDK